MAMGNHLQHLLLEISIVLAMLLFTLFFLLSKFAKLGKLTAPNYLSFSTN
jgi:hypothetical protein